VLSGTLAAAELPNGFGGIALGAKWDDLAESYPGRDLERVESPWDRYVRECGYRTLEINADKGRILVTLNDSIVTELIYITSIKQGSDVSAVADLVMRNYGQPESAAMRDLFGQVTIDRKRVNFVALEYRRSRMAEFTISAAPLWEYRIRLRHRQFRWHENKTLRCARAKEKAARGKND